MGDFVLICNWGDATLWKLGCSSFVIPLIPALGFDDSELIGGGSEIGFGKWDAGEPAIALQMVIR